MIGAAFAVSATPTSENTAARETVVMGAGAKQLDQLQLKLASS